MYPNSYYLTLRQRAGRAQIPHGWQCFFIASPLLAMDSLLACGMTGERPLEPTEKHQAVRKISLISHAALGEPDVAVSTTRETRSCSTTECAVGMTISHTPTNPGQHQSVSQSQTDHNPLKDDKKRRVYSTSGRPVLVDD